MGSSGRPEKHDPPGQGWRGGIPYGKDGYSVTDSGPSLAGKGVVLSLQNACTSALLGVVAPGGPPGARPRTP